MVRAAALTLVALASVSITGCELLSEWGSPGPLDPGHPHDEVLGGVASHAAIGNRCGACHVQLGTTGGNMSSRCVSCHADLEHEQVAVGECRMCHGEHSGSPPPLARSRTGERIVHHRMARADPR